MINKEDREAMISLAQSYLIKANINVDEVIIKNNILKANKLISSLAKEYLEL